MKDSADSDGKLLLASSATQHALPTADTSHIGTIAFRADWFVSPAEVFQVFSTLAIAVETRYQLRKRHANIGHSQSPKRKNPVAKKPKLKPTKRVIREIFPDEIVKELDHIVEEVDSDTPRMENPIRKGARPIKPWGGKWVKRRGR